MEELKGKKILLLAPKFFGYEIDIKKELENFGSEVFYFDERPSNDFLTKVFIRLNLKKLIKKSIDSYYEDIIISTKNESLDYLFLVAPETIDNKKIKNIKKIHKNIKIYTYMWDSVRNRKKSLDLLPISDRFFTFDKMDKSIDEKIEFLPLFYINEYKNIADDVSDLKYDLSFIGTIHSDRYKVIKKFEQFSERNNMKIFFYFYSPSKILFFFQKLLKKDFKDIDKNDISYISLNKNDVVDIIKKSKIIIDIHHPLQSGLTMRTIEVLGAKRKLYTTNDDVKNYDFYDENNICYFDRNNPNIEIEFFRQDNKNIDNNIYEKYSLTKWIQYIFKKKSK